MKAKPSYDGWPSSPCKPDGGGGVRQGRCQQKWTGRVKGSRTQEQGVSGDDTRRTDGIPATRMTAKTMVTGTDHSVDNGCCICRKDIQLCTAATATRRKPHIWIHSRHFMDREKLPKHKKKNALVSSQYASPSNAARDRAAAVTQATTTTTGSGLATNDNPPLIECRLGAYTRSFTVDFPCPSRGNC